MKVGTESVQSLVFWTFAFVFVFANQGEHFSPLWLPGEKGGRMKNTVRGAQGQRSSISGTAMSELVIFHG